MASYLVRIIDSLTLDGNCTTGDIQLSSYIDNNSTYTREGRIEICVNNAWGTVCDEFFDNNDATVACTQLSGFRNTSMYEYYTYYDLHDIMFSDALIGAVFLNRGSIEVGTGPIYLSELICTGDESSLLDCSRRRHQPIGLQTCDHNQDVAVRCTGE